MILHAPSLDPTTAASTHGTRLQGHHKSVLIHAQSTPQQLPLPQPYQSQSHHLPQLQYLPHLVTQVEDIVPTQSSLKSQWL